MSGLPTGWRAVAIYAWYDLKSMVRNPALWLATFGFPLLMLGMSAMVAVPMMVLGDSLEEGVRVWVQGAQPAWEQGLRDALAEGDLEVSGFGPAPPRALEAGVADVVLTLGDDAWRGEGIEVRLGPDVLSYQERAVRRRVGDWLVRAWVEERAGPLPAVTVLTEDGAPLEARATEAESAGPLEGLLGGGPAGGAGAGSQAAEGGIGFFVIGLFGTMLGVGMGPALVKSIRQGFNHVLSVGTSTRVIYFTELFTGAVMQAAQVAGWWLLYAVGMLLYASASDVDPPEPLHVLQSMPLMAFLAAAALVTSASVSLVVTLAIEELPQTVRERAPGFVLLVLIVVGSVLGDLLTPAVLGVLAAAPVVGPLALWFAWQGGETWVLALVPVQLAWAWGALILGAWAFALDESPLTFLRRRRAG